LCDYKLVKRKSDRRNQATITKLISKKGIPRLLTWYSYKIFIYLKNYNIY
jgi:hypothetical protein